MSEIISLDELMGGGSSSPAPAPRSSSVLRTSAGSDAEAFQIASEADRRGQKVSVTVEPGNASVTDDVIRSRLPGGTAASKAKSSNLLSLDDLMGTQAADPSAPPRGFKANLKLNSWEDVRNLWAEESLPANLLQAYERGALTDVLKGFRLKPDPTAATAEELETAGRPAFGVANRRGKIVKFAGAEAGRKEEPPEGPSLIRELIKQAQEDPGGLGGKLARALAADPYLLGAPIGLGGRLPTAALRTGGKAAAAAGRTIEGAASGAGLNTAVQIAQDLKESGEIDPRKATGAAGFGALLGGPLAGAFGRTRSPRAKAPEGPFGDALPQLTAEPEPIYVDPRGGAGSRAQHAAAEERPPLEGQFTRLPEDWQLTPPPEIKLLTGPAARELSPEAKAQHVGELDDHVIRYRQEIAQLKNEIGELEISSSRGPMKDLSGKLSDADFKLKLAESRLGDIMATRTRLGGAVPSWAKTLGIGVGAYAAAQQAGHGDDALIGLGLLGAMKAKGGMWHPKAAEVLAGPIKDRLTGLGVRPGVPIAGETNLAAVAATDTWAQRASQSYLNKHMGTETDPLKDIEIPFGEGTKRWGEVTDDLVFGRAAKNLKYDRATADALQKVPDNEQVWDVYSHAGAVQGYYAGLPTAEVVSLGKSASALKSYLSHVGDFLRENVPPEKLPQYDLVRAVKETAKRDAEMAKAMEREAADATGQLPVHKEYGDGFKWVEIAPTGKLTAEQRKSVRAISADEATQHTGLPPEDHGLATAHVALDANGKPIRNNYTDALAIGETPEEAWLAGQLAREGNQMGHCVGGYCEGVASGESKIYSLRDAKGKSHVTIEVGAPEKSPRGWHQGREELGPDTPPSILQIKGKQNRAPNADYLPYVQDFVKGGKWGDVGDLENSGLIKHPKKDEFLTPEEGRQRALAVVEQMWPDGKMYDDPRSPNVKALLEGQHEGISGAQQAQRQAIQDVLNFEKGFADPKLLIPLAALGLGGLAGAALSPEHPIRGALLGGLATAALGTSAGRTLARKGIFETADAADYGLGLVSTRIRNISSALHHRMVDFERNTLKRTWDELEKVVPLMKGLKNLKSDAFDSAILTNDAKAVRAALREAGLEDAWNTARSALNSLGKELNQHGRFRSMLDDYFPRVVKDFKGLMEHLGKAEKDSLEILLGEAEKKAMKSRGAGLTDVEKSAIINQHLLRPDRFSHLPDFARRRSIQEVTQDLLPFYHSPSEGLFQYMVSAVQDLEKMKLFGKNAVQGESGGKKFLDVEASIGNLLGEEMKKGKIDYADVKELESMLKSRFGPGEQAMPGWMQDFRNYTNTALLGNPVAAATQVGDVLSSVFYHGLTPTLVGIARSLGKNSPVSAREMGMLRHVAEELGSTPRRSAKVLDAALRYGGFSGVDQFGKNVNLNAALSKYNKWAQTERGQAKIARKYEEAFGADYPQLLSDLKSKTKSDLVDSLLFHELSDAQPLTKLETTQFLLDHPKVRILGQLKSFLLKQIDIARRTGYNEIKAGNRAKGLGELTKLAGVLGMAGVGQEYIKDILLGQEHDEISDIAAENIFKNFGFSQFVRDKVSKGEPLGAAGTLLVPPYKIFDDITKDLMREDSEKPLRSLKYIPIIGRIYEARFAGGNERERERKDLKRERALDRLMGGN